MCISTVLGRLYDMTDTCRKRDKPQFGVFDRDGGGGGGDEDGDRGTYFLVLFLC